MCGEEQLCILPLFWHPFPNQALLDVVEDVFSSQLILKCSFAELCGYSSIQGVQSRAQFGGKSDKTHTTRSDKLGKTALFRQIKCHSVCRWHFHIISRWQHCSLRPLTIFNHRSESRMCMQSFWEIMQIWTVWTPKVFVWQIEFYAEVITFRLGKWPTHFLFK